MRIFKALINGVTIYFEAEDDNDAARKFWLLFETGQHACLVGEVHKMPFLLLNK